MIESREKRVKKVRDWKDTSRQDYQDPCLQGTTHLLEVECPRTLPTCAEVLETGSGEKGTIILVGGGRGAAFYRQLSKKPSLHWILRTLLKDGFKLVETRFPDGIWTYPASRSYGSRTLACRFAAVVEWVYREIHGDDKDKFFAAQGNCGGTAQIAFGLCYYGLHKKLHLANLASALPPCPRKGIENFFADSECKGDTDVRNDSTAEVDELADIDWKTELGHLWCFLAIKGVVGMEWARHAEPILMDNPEL